VEARECVAEASQLREGETAVVERIDVARIDRRGALEARQSLLVAEKLGQDVSAGDQCRDGIGIDVKGPFAAGHRFLVTAEILERDAAVAERIDVAGPRRQQLLVAASASACRPSLARAFPRLVSAPGCAGAFFKTAS